MKSRGHVRAAFALALLLAVPPVPVRTPLFLPGKGSSAGAGVSALGGPQARWKARPQRPIRVEVNLVNVIASVLDPSGRPLSELTGEAFEIYEEGKQQKIEVFEAETQQPLDLALMIDTSLSAVKELRFEQEAAAHFVRQVMRPGDRLAVFEFADTVAQLSDFSGDVPALQAAVRHMGPGAGTSLYDAVYLGAHALERRPPERRRVILLVTDAGETTSTATFDTARRAALRAEAMLYTVLVRPVKSESGRNTAGEHALVTITEVTGGAMYRVDSLVDFEPTFDQIDRELRTQYRLGYYPVPRPPARSYRRIEVRVKGCLVPGAEEDSEGRRAAAPASGEGKCVIRYRKGYFTAE